MSPRQWGAWIANIVRGRSARRIATRGRLCSLARVMTLVVLTVNAALATASAAGTAPFDSAHEPPIVTSPNVSTGRTPFPGDTNSFAFFVVVDATLTCPAGQPALYTVTLSDPTGTTTVTTLDPCSNAVWGAVPANPALDFVVSTFSATVVFYPNRSTPFLYQVSGPNGVVAQGAMTATVTPPTEIDQQSDIDNFINVCINGNYTLYSKNGGDLYCIVSGDKSYAVGGWPAPKTPTPVSTPSKPKTTPILAGPWASYQRGYGHARPSTVDNGGDPTGVVTHIHWKSWGRSQAIGTGISDYVGPNQSVATGTEETARIVAFHLGTCHGRRAYDAIEWYFPQHGDHFMPGDYIDPCTGTYYQNGKPVG
jgi:hypothetical protein